MWCSLPRPLVRRSAFDEDATRLCALGITDSHRTVPLVCSVPRLVLWGWRRGPAVLAQIRGGRTEGLEWVAKAPSGSPHLPVTQWSPA